MNQTFDRLDLYQPPATLNVNVAKVLQELRLSALMKSKSLRAEHAEETTNLKSRGDRKDLCKALIDCFIYYRCMPAMLNFAIYTVVVQVCLSICDTKIQSQR